MNETEHLHRWQSTGIPQTACYCSETDTDTVIACQRCFSPQTLDNAYASCSSFDQAPLRPQDRRRAYKFREIVAG
jgi:hypothetical protein